VSQTTYKCFVKVVIKPKRLRKRKNVKIDKEIDTPMGKVIFRGELTEEELDYVITVGLVTMMVRGDLSATYALEDGTLLSDVPEQLQ